MKRSLCALAFVLALGCPALAREIPCPPVVPPPPTASAEATTEGDMHYPLVQIALTLLALF